MVLSFFKKQKKSLIRLVLAIIVVFWIALPLSYQIQSKIRGDLLLRIVRILSINIPYLAIFLIIKYPSYSFFINYMILLPIILSIIYILIDFKNLSYSNNPAIFSYFGEVRKEQLLSRFSEVTVMPLIEELFYRGTIPITGSIKEILIIFLLTTLLFNLAHYIGQSNDITFHLKLFILSLFSFLIYYFTHNIIYSIIFHVLCNIPWFVTNYRMYLYSKKQKNEVF